MAALSASQDKFLRSARAGHLATSDSKGRPHVIPFCYVFDGAYIYSVLDGKPKTSPLRQLRRVRNILENPHVSVVVDHYEEDWSRLNYVLISGRASLLEAGDEWLNAIEMLRKKYPQYRHMDLNESPVIKIDPIRYSPWSSQL